MITVFMLVICNQLEEAVGFEPTEHEWLRSTGFQDQPNKPL